MNKTALMRLLLLVVLGALALAALSADGNCWKPPRPNCPSGISNENGKHCGADSLIQVSDEMVRSQDNLCVGKSRNCQNANRDCNVLLKMDALWRKVYCVNQKTGYKEFLGWCIDTVFSNTATGLDCSGKKCEKPEEEIDPIPDP